MLDAASYYDLESQSDIRRLTNPELALGSAEGLVVLDEIQRMPELFAVLRVLVDRPATRARFLLLGSASPEVIKNASESLAGRVELVELSPFDLSEVGPENLSVRWLRGGFPRSFLARSDADSLAWRENFIRTFLERDLGELGFSLSSVAMRRFWTMLAHDNGQLWNSSRLGRSLGLSDKTVRSRVDLLAGTFMVRQLEPWHENLRKRQVKAPKIYVRDSGVLHALLGLESMKQLLGHPGLGASWEGFALEQTLRVTGDNKAYFWATHQGAELDLLMFKGRQRVGVEFKRADAPKVTPSMRIAIRDLKLDALYVVHPGLHRFKMADGIEAVPLWAVLPAAGELQ